MGLKAVKPGMEIAKNVSVVGVFKVKIKSEILALLTFSWMTALLVSGCGEDSSKNSSNSPKSQALSGDEIQGRFILTQIGQDAVSVQNTVTIEVGQSAECTGVLQVRVEDG